MKYCITHYVLDIYLSLCEALEILKAREMTHLEYPPKSYLYLSTTIASSQISNLKS